jgi:hypothetical protein
MLAVSLQHLAGIRGLKAAAVLLMPLEGTGVRGWQTHKKIRIRLVNALFIYT